MSKKPIFKNLLQIYALIDKENKLDRKLETLETWLGQLEGISLAAILNFQKTPEEIKTYGRFKKSLPEKPEILYFDSAPTPLPESWQGELLCYPVIEEENKISGAILLKGSQIEEIHKQHQMELKFLTSKVKELLKIGVLESRLNQENEFIRTFIHKSSDSLEKIYSHNSSRLINWINLPLYITDLTGKLIYANKAFINTMGYNTLEELCTTNIFSVPEQRKRELEHIRRFKRVDNFRLTVKRKNGTLLAIRDSALILGTHIFGFYFDVTELVRLNKEITEALSMQEQLNDQLINSSLTLQKTQNTTIRSLARLAEYRDRETGSHLDRICEYTGVLVRELYDEQPYSWRITEKYMADLVLSSMLHDIGKVGIPDSILLKPGRLNDKEFENMKNHTIWGWAILNEADKELGEQSYLTIAASIALHHHERYDGNGYPDNLKGEKIPLSARIETIADVYDALTSERPYKQAWSHEQSVELIKSEKGKQFDPLLVDIFLNVEDKFYTICNKHKEQKNNN